MQSEKINPVNPIKENTCQLTGNKQIIPIEKLIELRSKGLTYEQIGNIVGITKQGVFNRLRDYDEDIQGTNEFNHNKAYHFSILQRQLLRALTPFEIKKLSAHQKVWSLGVITDKCLTLEGKANLNIDIRSMIQHTSKDLDSAKRALDVVLGNAADITPNDNNKL